MTTINNSQLIEKVGGIEKAREIVEGAPESNFPVKWCLVRKKYVRQFGFNTQCLANGEWIDEFNINPWTDLDTLRTAIAEYSPDSYGWVGVHYKLGDHIVYKKPWVGHNLVLKIGGDGNQSMSLASASLRQNYIRHATPEESKQVTVWRQNVMDKFEEWFASQNFYANMRFIHGDGLFIKDGEVYRVLPVQMSWKSWQSRQSEFDSMTEALLNQTQLLAKKQDEVDQLKEAIERQGKLAIQAMNEAHKGSRLELSIAKDIQASLKPELIESERQMNEQLTDENMKLEARIEEKDKRLEELEKLIEVGRYARQRFINKFIGIQNHIEVNAFKAMESDPECFVIGAEDLTEFIKEVLRGEHE